MSYALDELRTLDTPLVLYVGEQLPLQAGLPSRQQLVQELLREAEDMLSARQHRELTELASGMQLSAVLSELERALTPAAFGRIVERRLDDDAVEVPPLGRAIAGLGDRIRGVVTSNLDHLVERAFAGELVVHGRAVADLASRKGWLLKLHGTLRDRSTWVLTDEQLGRSLYRDPMQADVFRSLFLAHPVLFVGTRLDEPVLGELLQRVQALSQGQPPRHWALVDSDDAGPIRRRQLAAAGVELIPCQDEAGLQEALASLAGGGKAAAPSATAGTPAQVAPAPTPSVVQSAPAPAPVSAAASPAPTDSAAQSPAPQTDRTQLSVLFLAANPSGTDPLRLDRELRIIREAIERSRHREALKLEIRTAATVHDLRRALLDTAYDVVHVSGHGEEDGLLLEDDQGECVQIPKSAVARLFSRYTPPRGSLRCVLLNACWTLATGEDPSMQVPYTVAMDGPISDRGALEFSRGFYDALGAGLDFSQAYEEGCSSVELAAPGARFESKLLQD